jgi:cathepsin L
MSPLTPTLVLLLAAAAMASTATEWAKFKLQHEKVYSEEEDNTRMNIWNKNVKMVAKHNSEKHSYTMAINRFSDWTEEEFNNFLGYQARAERSTGKTFENVKTPETVDYRDEGKVTPPKDQGQCGSCWAFSATGALEGLWAKEMGELVSMSEQQLMDCGQGGCNGGHMINGWNHVAQAGGIQSEETYPYKHKDGHCQEDNSMFVAHCGGYEEVSPNESAMESALVEIGYPISIGVHAGSSFQHYHSGVYDDTSCKHGQLNHAILVVGYDKSGSEPYWIVKNSWGGSWGDHGYINMKMGVNTCGMKADPCYPTM